MSTESYDEILNRARTELSQEEQDRLSAELAQHVARSNGGIRKITDLRGLGKEIWKDVDADDYVSEERNSWDG